MGTRNRLLFWMTIGGLLFTLLPGIAAADTGSLGAVGYAVIPMQNDQVRMDAERIVAEIREDQAWVTCMFTFTNAGPDTEVLMGFPQARSRGNTELHDFRALVDGQELPVTFRPQAGDRNEEPYVGWHTFVVPFAAGQARCQPPRPVLECTNPAAQAGAEPAPRVAGHRTSVAV